MVRSSGWFFNLVVLCLCGHGCIPTNGHLSSQYTSADMLTLFKSQHRRYKKRGRARLNASCDNVFFRRTGKGYRFDCYLNYTLLFLSSHLFSERGFLNKMIMFEIRQNWLKTRLVLRVALYGNLAWGKSCKTSIFRKPLVPHTAHYLVSIPVRTNDGMCFTIVLSS